MIIKLLKRGDHVETITSEFIAIKHKNGEIDVYPITIENEKIKIHTKNITTIGFENEVKTNTIDGVTITTF